MQFARSTLSASFLMQAANSVNMTSAFVTVIPLAPPSPYALRRMRKPVNGL
jgi:hypothetical protein